MAHRLTEFHIIKLHGEADYTIQIEDNRLILVSENGMGKTTIVNIIYYTLSQQWHKLTNYIFEEIGVVINGTRITIHYNELSDLVRVRHRNPRTRDLRKRLPLKYRRVVDQILEFHDINSLMKNPRALTEVANTYDVSIEFLKDIFPELIESRETDLFFSDFEHRISLLRAFNESQILYLPTYRRIEQDLKYIFPDLNADLEDFRNQKRWKEKQNQSFLELVEFGMEDVEKKISDRLKELDSSFKHQLKNNLTGTYLKDIINKKYKKYSLSEFQKINLEELEDILSRIDKSILSEDEKNYLRSFVKTKQDMPNVDDDDKVVGHFVSSLMNIYEQQKEEESDVEHFVKICNNYMAEKEFIYDRDELDIRIKLRRNNRRIYLKNLSSGEKQIVSLFSHLYLSGEKHYFVIIDEPELSLSVLWQERLLPDIIKSNLCSGLIAVTHSPFVYKNDLKQYTHSLQEFKLLQ